MTQATQPPRRTGDAPRAADDLDDVLRAFFRAQLPNPWPAAPLPAASATRRGTRRSVLRRSRLALAASVALLVAGPLCLGTSFRGPGTPPDKDVPLSARGVKTELLLAQPPDGPTTIKVNVEFIR